MRIAHIVDGMEVGGAETVVSQLCRLQRAQGHEPSVYAIATLGPIGQQMCNEGFSVHPHVGRKLPNALRTFFKIFKQTKPDVVHLHNPTPTLYAGISARMAGVRCIVSTRHSLAAPPRKVLAELKYAVGATCCDWVIGICDATVNNLKSLHVIPRGKIVRVYNGALALQRVAEDRWPLKTGFTLVSVGRLEPVKNHALLLAAFQRALATLPALRLWMVGHGSQRSMLEVLAADLGISQQITFWGQQLDVAPYLCAADAFIMSSSSEGLPISLLQAFSLGLPAIVTDVGGMGEVVRLSDGGVTVHPDNPGDMASAIVRLARNRAEHARLSKAAEDAFFSRFTLEMMARSYMDLYSDAD